MYILEYIKLFYTETNNDSFALIYISDDSGHIYTHAHIPFLTIFSGNELLPIVQRKVFNQAGLQT